jgi:hypothetical protein
MGAVSTSVTTVAASGTASTSSFDQTPATVPTTSLVLGALDTTNSVEFTNFYDEGSIELSKQILGTADDTWGDTEFTVNVTCTLADPTDSAASRGDVFDTDFTFSNALGLGPVLIDHLPAGADCVITETDDGSATSTEIDVDGVPTPGTSVTVSVTDEVDPTEIVVKNTFDYTSIEVFKERTGAGAGLYDDGPYEVTLSCDFQGAAITDADVPDGLTHVLDADNLYYTVFENLPIGADCTIEETATGGANSTEIRLGVAGTPTAGTSFDLVTTGATADVYVTNDFEVGDLTVSKTVTGDAFLYGDGSPLYGSIGFEVTLACERDVDGVATPVVLPYAANVTLDGGNGYTHDFENLPVGAVCEITETRKGFAATSTVGAPVTILANGAGAPLVSIDVVNDFQLGTLSLGKESLGLFAARHAGNSFQVTVECWQDVDGTLTRIDPIKDGDVREIKAGEVTEFEDLPVPAECTFDELDNGGADMGVYSVAAVPMLGSTVSVDPGTMDVQLANLFLLASTGSDADVWIIGALISLLSGVCLVILGRRRERVRSRATS